MWLLNTDIGVRTGAYSLRKHHFFTGAHFVFLQTQKSPADSYDPQPSILDTAHKQGFPMLVDMGAFLIGMTGCA